MPAETHVCPTHQQRACGAQVARVETDGTTTTAAAAITSAAKNRARMSEATSQIPTEAAIAADTGTRTTSAIGTGMAAAARHGVLAEALRGGPETSLAIGTRGRVNATDARKR